MVRRDELIKYLNDYLSVNDFSDYGPQGLQVEGREEVRSIVTGGVGQCPVVRKSRRPWRRYDHCAPRCFMGQGEPCRQGRL